jgi:hypothetical protein
MEIVESELCQLLIDCLKKDGPAIETARLSGLSPEHAQDFLSLAKTQRVSPLLWHRLKQKGLDKALPINVAEDLSDVSRQHILHNLRLYGELRRLLFALKSEEIPLILLKGIYLADAVYGNIGLREMNDIDVLARCTDLTRISEIMAGMGYSSLQPICADVTCQTHHHLPVMVKSGHAVFDIHWNLTCPGEYYSIDPARLWAHAIPSKVAGCEVLTLSPDDLLLHLCLHTSYHHCFAFGLRPSCDIAETIARFGSNLDWQTITEQATRRGWQRGVYLALRLAEELAGADVPTDALERLRPADISETILMTARAQVFSDKNLSFSVPVRFAELLESRHLRDKIRIFWQQVFMPKAMIAAQYSVPMDSARIYVCYPLRLFYLLRRYINPLIRYQKNDAPLKGLAARKSRISNWLAGMEMHR